MWSIAYSELILFYSTVVDLIAAQIVQCLQLPIDALNEWILLKPIFELSSSHEELLLLFMT
jgi:hypothetical protein